MQHKANLCPLCQQLGATGGKVRRLVLVCVLWVVCCASKAPHCTMQLHRKAGHQRRQCLRHNDIKPNLNLTQSGGERHRR